MTSYSIPIFFEPFERQKKAARFIHLLAAFLMIANAWGDFNQPTPNLFFTVTQLAAAFIVILFVVAGKKLFVEWMNSNGLFRIIEALIFLYAAWYFSSRMNMNLMSITQMAAAAGLLFLFFTERKIFHPTNVRMDEKGIYTPNNMADRFIPWSSVENMLVKSDYISINTTKNQFIQFEISSILSEAQMDAANAFCRTHFVQL